MKPKTPPRPLDAAGRTDAGRVQSHNEDQFVLADMGRAMRVQSSSLPIADASRVAASRRAHLMLVADGSGGARRGEAASSAAAGEASRYVLEHLPCARGTLTDEDVREHLRELVRHAESAVRAVDADGAGDAPASTLTLAFLQDTRLHLAHVGDSRCYALTGGHLRRLTADHTLGATSVELNALRAREDARETGRPEALRNALGEEGNVRPDVRTFDVEAVDAVLLCSSGLTRHVEDERIAAILAGATGAEDACRRLVHEANERGGTDNVTAVVAYLTSPTAHHRVLPDERSAQGTAGRAPDGTVPEPGQRRRPGPTPAAGIPSPGPGPHAGAGGAGHRPNVDPDVDPDRRTARCSA